MTAHGHFVRDELTMAARGASGHLSRMMLPSARSGASRHAPALDVVDRAVRELALHDGIVLAHLVVLFVAVLGGSGERRTPALAWLLLDLAVFVTVLVVSRGGALSRPTSGLAYRIGLLAGVLGPFFQLHLILPAGTSRLVDADLYAFDKSFFGVEPAEAWDKLVTIGTTEWFSFFYFSYFVVLAAHVFPFMFARDRERLSELATGIVSVFCIGHVLYLVVPGHGPYVHLADGFTHALEGPVFWPLVKATVDSVEMSARTDIFPSLHTAAPTFLALFAARHRRVRPFRWTWIPSVFVASQIVLATMFLRWHYLVDVAAGLVLGTAAAFFAAWAAGWERSRREAAGLSPVFAEMRREIR